MFTGIVEELGVVAAVEPRPAAARLIIDATKVLEDVSEGASIAVNGVCLTVTSWFPHGEGQAFAADVMQETLDRSSLGGLRAGDRVNLERPVRLADRLGGHLVQGHVDGVGVVLERRSSTSTTTSAASTTTTASEVASTVAFTTVSTAASGDAAATGGDPVTFGPDTQWEIVRISLPPGLERYLVEKGSITVDGVSLTVVEITPADATTPATFTVSLIPTTLQVTTLGRRGVGERVNLEVDVLAKYVEKLVVAGEAAGAGSSSTPVIHSGSGQLS
ncbi:MULTISPECIES: riboflavin synthase [Protofrankia]|uniref:Riboflavin synthase n=1 Tax=Candidatus Protofrankia datiscae TaxID=2716812 RepID=F8AV52_9ACTN|nr:MULTISPECIES: riboflavin synthase [Protofrankia]AEH10603.1 riboflavin synthase, alpha subunit [Candidatus Protofrankia datiscae]